MRIATAIILGLLLISCDYGYKGGAKANRADNDAPSRFVRPEFKSSFSTVAPAAYLGEGWTEHGGSDGVRQIWADPGGDRALILLRGAGYPALWLNREHSLLAQPVKFDYEPLYVDTQQGIAYAADAGRLLTRKLPDGEWETRFGAQGSGSIQAVSGHTLSKSVWVLMENTQSAADVAAKSAPQAPDVAKEASATPPPDAVKEVHGDPDKLVHSLLAVRLDTGEPRKIEVPAGDAGAQVQLVTLKDGRAFASVGGDVFLLDPDSGASVGQQVYSGDRDLLLAADIADSAAWVYVDPHGASSGTGRTTTQAAPGELIVLDNTGKELARQEVGQIHFSQLAGDWKSQRALLARNGAGVLVVDYATGKPSWALRDGGEVPLQLVGDGARLWALLPDGISGISANKLIKLAPTLAAAQVLPREQMQPVKTAVEALGWDWKSTLISPLSPNTGRITLFNAADPGSELAELDWSSSRKHVSRLLAARPALDTDKEFAALAPDLQRVQMEHLLAALGWPAAQIDELRSVSGAGEVTYTYTLKQDCPEGCSGGEFSLWQGDSLLLTLDAPTADLPADIVAMDTAKENALAALLAQNSTPRIDEVKAGWVVEGQQELLPEAEGNAIPVYEVYARSDLPECRQYRVLLNARSGELLALNEGKCGPLGR